MLTVKMAICAMLFIISGGVAFARFFQGKVLLEIIAGIVASLSFLLMVKEIVREEIKVAPPQPPIISAPAPPTAVTPAVMPAPTVAPVQNTVVAPASPSVVAPAPTVAQVPQLAPASPSPVAKPEAPVAVNCEQPGAVFQDTLKDGSLGPKMVVIPAGKFQMGDIQGTGESDEKPVHWVEVKSFAMGQYEVTRGEFRQFVEAAGYKTEAETSGGCYSWTGKAWEQKAEFTWRNVGFAQEDTHPVVCISWDDAVVYAKWLSQQTGKSYRLPTEAEWEYAAKAGTNTDYWWGNTASHEYANYGKDECCEGLAQGKDHGVFTSPVGSFKANPFGLYDTVGNVWERTCSAYTDSYAGQELQCSNNEPHVLRGSSWLSYGLDCRATNRSRYYDRGNSRGFRVLMFPPC